MIVINSFAAREISWVFLTELEFKISTDNLFLTLLLHVLSLQMCDHVFTFKQANWLIDMFDK